MMLRRPGVFRRIVLAGMAAFAAICATNGPAGAQSKDLEELLAPFLENEAANQEPWSDPTVSAAPPWHQCLILIIEPGTLAPNPILSQLSSKASGGQPGSSLAYASTGQYEISIDATSAFISAPQGGDDGTTFVSTYSGSGATVFSEQPGNEEVKLKRGITSIKADLVVDRVGSPFPAGDYQASLTLRCE